MSASRAATQPASTRAGPLQEAIASLRATYPPRLVAAGAPVYSTTNREHQVAIILDGAGMLYGYDRSGTGESSWIDVIEPGAIIAEQALGAPAPLTVIAHSPCALLLLTAAQWAQVITRFPALQREATKQCLTRAANAQARLVELKRMTPTERLHSTIMRLKTTSMVAVDADGRRTLQVKRSQLADLAGVSERHVLNHLNVVTRNGDFDLKRKPRLMIIYKD